MKKKNRARVKSKREKAAENIIKSVIQKYKEWSMMYKTEEICMKCKKYNMQYDGTLEFCINNKSLKIHLEYDGFQHFDRSHYWNKKNRRRGGFNSQNRRDKLKEKITLDREQSLIRICSIRNNTFPNLTKIIDKTIAFTIHNYIVIFKIRDNVDLLFKGKKRKKYDQYTFDDLYQIFIHSQEGNIYTPTLNQYLQ